jgi:hypothetical protein
MIAATGQPPDAEQQRQRAELRHRVLRVAEPLQAGVEEGGQVVVLRRGGPKLLSR